MFNVVSYRRTSPKGWWNYPTPNYEEAIAWAMQILGEGDHVHIQSDHRWN